MSDALKTPAGMRDALPPEAAARREVSNAFLARAALHGYAPVVLPVFEYEETIARGLGALDPQEMVRFVEPETGEVVALRPDVTPQIARLVATRLASYPPPYRLAYDASIVRRRAGSRARTHREIAQVGVELVGAEGVEADLEPIVLAAASLAASGLRDLTIDLGHAEIVRTLLARAAIADGVEEEIVAALTAKDVARLARATGSITDPAIRDALAMLPAMHGDRALLDDIPSALVPIAHALAPLRTLADALARALSEEGIPGARITVDLGEVRGHAYYTGVFFQMFAEGPGVPVAGGGRYDGLLARFGRALPATGVAIDVDAWLWAMRAGGVASPAMPPKVVIRAGEGAQALARELRARGVAVVVMDGETDTFARAWGASRVVDGAASAESIVASLRPARDLTPFA